MSIPPLVPQRGGPQPSPIQTDLGKISYDTSGIQPPSPLQLTRDDDILIKIFAPTIALNFTVNVELRLLTPEGEIKPSRFPVLVNASSATLRRNIGECFVLSAGASLAGGATANRGQVFVQLFVVRNVPNDVLTLWTLFSEYVTTNFRPSWPNGIIRSPLEGNGNLRSIIGSAPALGSDFRELTPIGVRWLLRAANFTLTTNATATQREVALRIDDGANLFYLGPAAFQQAQSTARGYSFGRNVTNASSTSAQATAIPAPDVYLLAGWEFGSQTQQLQAGDQYSAINYSVEEWIDI